VSRANEPAAGESDPTVTFKGKRLIRQGRGYSFKLIFESSQPIDTANLAPATVFLAEQPSIVRTTTARKIKPSRDGLRVTVTYFADFRGVATAYSGDYNVNWPAGAEGKTVGGVGVISPYPYSLYGPRPIQGGFQNGVDFSLILSGYVPKDSPG
jgi:hypothetical protein